MSRISTTHVVQRLALRYPFHLFFLADYRQLIQNQLISKPDSKPWQANQILRAGFLNMFPEI